MSSPSAPSRVDVDARLLVLWRGRLLLVPGAWVPLRMLERCGLPLLGLFGGITGSMMATGARTSATTRRELRFGYAASALPRLCGAAFLLQHAVMHVAWAEDGAGMCMKIMQLSSVVLWPETATLPSAAVRAAFITKRARGTVAEHDQHRGPSEVQQHHAEAARRTRLPMRRITAASCNAAWRTRWISKGPSRMQQRPMERSLTERRHLMEAKRVPRQLPMQRHRRTPPRRTL